MTSTSLKIWISIGAVSALAVLILPPLLVYTSSEDVKRYRECVVGLRTDCHRTIVWNLVDVAVLLKQQKGGSLEGTALEGLGRKETSGAVRTSETSPFIEKVEPKGMSNENGTYVAKAGTPIRFRATMSGTIAYADLYAMETLNGEAQRPKKVVSFEKAADGAWETTYALAPGYSGTVEVRAYGENPKDLAILALSVAAK